MEGPCFYRSGQVRHCRWLVTSAKFGAHRGSLPFESAWGFCSNLGPELATLTSDLVTLRKRGTGHMPGAKDLDPGGSLEEYIGDQVREARLKLFDEHGKRWTQAYLAGRVFSNQTRIGEVERGEEAPDLPLARKLEKTLKLPLGYLTNLVRILQQDNVRDYAKPFIRHRADATAIYEFRMGIPGLLQTPEYARGALQAGFAGDEAQIDVYVAARMEHRKLLDKPSPPWLVAMMDEASLRRVTGSRETMRKQLEYLLEMTERPSVNLLVLPAAAPAVSGSFTLLTRPTGERTAYTEGFNCGSYIEETAEVQRFQQVYDLLHQGTLSGAESQDLMRALVKDYT